MIAQYNYYFLAAQINQIHQSAANKNLNLVGLWNQGLYHLIENLKLYFIFTEIGHY